MRINFDSSKSERKLSPNAARAMIAGLTDELLAWRVDDMNTFRDTHLNGRPGLNRVSGNLARSFVPTLSGDASSPVVGFMFLPNMQADAGEVESYAGIHEAGGVITAKNGKMLAWPVAGGPAQTQGGVSCYGASPRNYPGKLFFYRATTGNMFLAESFGRGGNKLRLVYHLANSVTIQPRLGFKAFATESLERGRMRLVGRMARIASEMRS